MVYCQSCNTKCPDNANFCLHCGKPLKLSPKEKILKKLDSPVSSEAMTDAIKRLMPTSYVEKLLASKGKMVGERRVVTILFSDVKGSTELAENLDPEEVLEVMNGAFNVLIEPITRYEGTLARLMGDAILAFFGAPIAHEDDPYRACRAALDILKGAEQFSQKLESEKGIRDFGVRVGINTGLVVVAEVGTDLRVEYTAMGDAVNIAARMESAADPGTILITEDTKNLVEKNFVLSSVGPIRVKGKSEPINTFKVLGIKNIETSSKADLKFNSPLIGREMELNKLKEALNRLSEGSGGIISIVGESGIGKSRLVAELRKQNIPGLNWSEARALTYTLNKSYFMVRGWLKNYLGFHQESADMKMLTSLYKKIQSHFGNKTEEIYPFLEHFLKFTEGETDSNDPRFNDLAAVRGQFHYAVKEFISKESMEQPIVIAWEDLQWCDLPSLEILCYLLPLIEKKPILLLLQYRIDENEKRVWNFHYNNLKEYHEKHEMILLHPLTEDESNLFIKNLLGKQKLNTEMRNGVLTRTEGNPAFIEEVIHSTIEESELTGKLSNVYGVEVDIQISDLLQNVIMARVDRLEPQDKLILQTAAVIGRVFRKKLLVEVIKNDFDILDFDKSLNELQHREFILRHLPSNLSSAKISHQKEYIFKQDLVHSVIYNSLLLSQRQELHRHIGEQFEKSSEDNFEDSADLLAIHFEKGKVYSKAIHYYKIAGDRSKVLFANEDAIFFYSKILALSNQNQAEPLHLAQVHESMGDVYFLRANYSKAIDHFNLSLNLYRDSNNLAKIYFSIGQVFERWGDYEKALENYNNGLHQIEQLQFETLKANIYTGIGMVYYRQGNLKEAEEITKRALKILKETGNESDIADVYNNMGIISSKSGELDKSYEYHMQCLQIRERLGISSGLAASHNNLGYLYQIKNDLEKSVEYYEKSLEYCDKTGNQHGLARTYDNLSHIYILQGKQELAQTYNLKATAILGKIAEGTADVNADVWLQSGVW